MSALSLSVGQLLWGLLLAVVLTVVLYLLWLLPELLRLALLWNRRRLDRARRYRARHGTPWWLAESGEAERRRKWLQAQEARTAGLPRQQGVWR